MNDELICIKDKAKRLQYKRQIRMNELISMTIAQNTFNNKLTKTKIEKLTSLLTLSKFGYAQQSKRN